ncbi:hypothetical protein TUM18999_42290 [Pseudomonas tohonis]|uniref:Tail fiber protein n=1 Tax=Pseudomonas tohonis TaxID=2725477 RepID=A0A6J4E9E0_9PSED|nr:tail fiber protein [Pseudomonas tohonis]BCG26038.1 hypothetical protein TUM18999_42290 [Pseudomonas tohonis]GJN51231.1 hypothetical protein TUM20286_09830 [Pseudomonas tohonis]
MTQYNRPNEMVFASGAKPGELESFPDITRGWGVTFDQTTGIPPMEWFNALFKRSDEAVRYLLQRGIAEWSNTEDYPVDAHVQEGGKIWKAKVGSVGKRPSLNPTEWVETALTREALKTLIQEQLGGGTINFGQWQWSSATSGGVANGYLALNTTNPADATSLLIAKSSAEGLDYSRIVGLLRAGDTLCVQSRSGGTVAHRFRVTGDLVDSGSYRSVPVVYVSGAGGTPTANTPLQVLMTPAGGTVPAASTTDSQTDFNAVLEPGWYPRLLGGAAGARNANHPDGQAAMQKGSGTTNYYWLLVVRYSSNLIQVALPYVSGADTSLVTMKFRLLGGGIWSPWRSILHADNTQGTGLPAASVMWWSFRSSIPAGWAPADGQLLSRALYPDVWATVSEGKVPKTTEALWSSDPSQRGMFTEGDGSTTFRMPDYNGKAAGSLGALFMRGDGALSSGTPGLIQGDAIRNITGAGAKIVGSAPLGAFSAESVGNSPVGASGGALLSFDASRVVPTAAENRPLNTAGCWIIRMGGGIANSGTIDAAALSTTYATLVTRVEALEARPRTIGEGQAWQDLKATRATNTTYTNTTGRSIAVSVALYDNGSYASSIYVNGVVIGWWDQPTAITYTQTFLVPPGATYMVSGNAGSPSGNTLQYWAELR